MTNLFMASNNPSDNGFKTINVNEIEDKDKKINYENFLLDNNYKNVSVMCFSWNSSNNRLCESLDENVIEKLSRSF